MGITQQHALMLINEHMYRPLPERVHLLGRQTIHFDYETAISLCRRSGFEPLPVEIELDTETLGARATDVQFISDRTFFQMLGVKEVRAIDHSDYEGADIIIDLNRPLDPKHAATIDFLFGGSVCDNVFNPAGYIQNIAQLLRPGGRLLDQNIAAERYHEYVVLMPAWYFDFFVLNRFADCKVYVFEILDGWNAYHLDGLNPVAGLIENFPLASKDITLGVFIIAEKGRDSSWNYLPSQDQYRSDDEWERFHQALRQIREHPRPVQTYPATGVAARSPQVQEVPGYRFVGRLC